MYAVIRRYTGSKEVIEEARRQTDSLKDVMIGIPGFVAYYFVETADGLNTVTVCDDQAGTQESGRRAAEWVKQNMTPGAVAPPEVSEGEVVLSVNR